MTFSITTEDTGDTREREPHAAAFDNGNIVVAWDQHTSITTQDDVIGLRVLGSDGTPVTDEYFVVTGDGGATISYDEPQLATIDNNTFVLVYNSWDSAVSNYTVKARIITLTGTTLSTGPEVDVSQTDATYFASNHEIVVLDNGNIAVTFLYDDGTNKQAAIRVFDSTLTPLTAVTPIPGEVEPTPNSFNIDAVGNDVYVAWNQNTAGNTRVDVFGTIVSLNSDGTIADTGSATTLRTVGGTSPYLGLKDMHVLANGDVLVVSIGGPNTTMGPDPSYSDNDNLFGTILSSDLSAVVKPDFRINDFHSTFGVRGDLNIVPFEGGGFAVFWTQATSAQENTDETSEVHYQIFDNTYAADGSNQILTPASVGATEKDVVPLLTSPDGDITLVYSYSPTIDDEQLAGELLTALDPNPVATNSAPTLSGVPTDVTVTEDVETALDLSSIHVADSDDDNLLVTFSALNGAFVLNAFGVTSTQFALNGPAADANYFLNDPTQVSYIGPANLNGDNADSFTVVVNDGTVDSPVYTVNIDITAVNDAPVAKDDAISTTEGSATTGNVLVDNGSGADSDVELDPLEVLEVNGAAADVGNQIALASGALLTLNTNGTFSYDTNGQFEDLGVGQSTIDSFTYTVTDSAGGTDTASVSVTIEGQNDAPIARDDDVSTDEDTLLSGDLFADNGNGADTDIDGDPFEISALVTPSTLPATPATLASGAMVTLNANGTFEYDPNGQFESLGTGDSTTDSFQYYIDDGNLGTDIATVTVTISGVNDAPVAQDDAFATDEDTALSGNVFLDNGSGADLDVESDPLAVLEINGASADVGTQITLASGALLTMNANGDFSYDPNGAFDGLAAAASDVDSFTYTVSDGNGLTDTATVTLTITGENDAPTVSAPAAVTATEDTTATLDLSGLDFDDAEDDTLTVTLAASVGLLSATAASGVGVSGSGSAMLTLTGASAALNAFLASSVSYEGVANTFGDAVASLSVSADDGNGGTLASDPVIDINITNVNDDATGRPTISGTMERGETLTASLGTTADLDGFDAGAATWQWLRDGTAISGATGATYTLGLADIGARISVEVSFTDNGGTDEARTSARTTTVAFSGEIINGDDGNNVLRGTVADDVINGKGGMDVLRGLDGNDIVRGAEGFDVLFGGKGSDVLRGASGIDVLYGNFGRDALFGGGGRDFLYGGQGNDELTGGTGIDVFVFTRNGGDDVVTDFQSIDVLRIASGASDLSDLSFAKSGSDVVVSFASASITVENTTIAELRDVDNFLFT